MSVRCQITECFDVKNHGLYLLVTRIKRLLLHRNPSAIVLRRTFLLVFNRTLEELFTLLTTVNLWFSSCYPIIPTKSNMFLTVVGGMAAASLFSINTKPLLAAASRSCVAAWWFDGDMSITGICADGFDMVVVVVLSVEMMGRRCNCGYPYLFRRAPIFTPLSIFYLSTGHSTYCGDSFGLVLVHCKASTRHRECLKYSSITLLISIDEQQFSL